MPKASLAVTVTVVLLPAVMVEGEAITVKVLAAAGLTVTDVLPVMELVAVSVAVTDLLPAVFRVTVKVPVPLLRVASDGRTAWASPLGHVVLR